MRSRSGVRDSSVAARIAAGGALLGAVVLVVLILFGGGSSYTLKANFQDAGGLVAGNIVLIGPAQVGSVQSIGLTPNGLAQVSMNLNSDASPMHQGTVARIYQNSLSGIANKYVVLEPGPNSAPAIPDGGVIPATQAYSPVNLDQLFNTLTPATRAGLRGFIRGEAAAIEGKAPQAHRTLLYFAPGLESTSNVSQELVREEPAFDQLLVQGAKALAALGSRTQELTALVANGNATTGAIASQSNALTQTLQLLPGALTHTTATFAGLRSTLDALDPFVAASKVASRQLAPFAVGLRDLTIASIPTVAKLNALINNPGGGDLTSLFLETPSLARVAAKAFPQLIHQMNVSQAQVDYLREYAPDVVAALTNFGQAGSNYDANGHYLRAQPAFNAFSLDGANQLQTKNPALRYQGQQVVKGRCPGSGVQPPPDGSAPWAVPGCNPSVRPPGP